MQSKSQEMYNIRLQTERSNFSNMKGLCSNTNFSFGVTFRVQSALLHDALQRDWHMLTSETGYGIAAVEVLNWR